MATKRIIFIGVCLVLAIAVFGVANRQNKLSDKSTVSKSVSTTPEPKPLTAEGLYEETNKERLKAGVSTLKLNTLLNESASLKAKELQKEGWDKTPHVNNNGKQGYTYTIDVGANCIYSSENLLVNAKSLQDGFNWWMNSKPHRKAILDPRYESVGFAIVDKYVVQHFCDEY